MPTNLPSKEELLTELRTAVESSYLQALNKVREKANEIKKKYFEKVDEAVRTVSL